MKVPIDPDLLVAELEILQSRAEGIQSQLRYLADSAGSLGGEIEGLIRNVRYREERAKEALQDAALEAKEIAEKESM